MDIAPFSSGFAAQGAAYAYGGGGRRAVRGALRRRPAAGVGRRTRRLRVCVSALPPSGAFFRNGRATLLDRARADARSRISLRLMSFFDSRLERDWS